MPGTNETKARGVKATALKKRTELQVRFFLYRGSLGTGK